jgi:hypothetical protein
MGITQLTSNTLSMTAAAWLKPVSLVRSWAALTVLRTANSSFAPTSARHRVLLGGPGIALRIKSSEQLKVASHDTREEYRRMINRVDAPTLR